MRRDKTRSRRQSTSSGGGQRICQRDLSFRNLVVSLIYSRKASFLLSGNYIHKSKYRAAITF